MRKRDRISKRIRRRLKEDITINWTTEEQKKETPEEEEKKSPAEKAAETDPAADETFIQKDEEEETNPDKFIQDTGTPTDPTKFIQDTDAQGSTGSTGVNGTNSSNGSNTNATNDIGTVNGAETELDKEQVEKSSKLTRADVEKLSAGQIVNYVYVKMPTEIDPDAKALLLQRADQLRKDAEADKDTKERAKQILQAIGSNIDIGL